MAETLNFRTSFKGFHREDVVHYIEYLNSNHENQIQQMQADLARAQKEHSAASEAHNESAALLQTQLREKEDAIAELTAQNTELAAQAALNNDLAAQIVQLQAALSTLTLENNRLKSNASQAPADTHQTETIMALTAENTTLKARCAQVEASAADLQANLTTLTAENAVLKERCSHLEASASNDQSDVVAALTAEKAALMARCAQLEASAADDQADVVAALTAEKAALKARCAQLEATIASQEPASQSHMSACMEAELAAYRRAERVEREAKERANSIYQQLYSTLSDSCAKTGEVVNNLDGVADQIQSQLIALRTSLNASQSCLAESVAALENLRT